MIKITDELEEKIKEVVKEAVRTSIVGHYPVDVYIDNDLKEVFAFANVGGNSWLEGNCYRAGSMDYQLFDPLKDWAELDSTYLRFSFIPGIRKLLKGDELIEFDELISYHEAEESYDYEIYSDIQEKFPDAFDKLKEEYMELFLSELQINIEEDESSGWPCVYVTW